MPPIIIDGTRIFTPDEAMRLYMRGEKPWSRSEFLYFLSSGFDYKIGTEYHVNLHNPKVFNTEKRYIIYNCNYRWDQEKTRRSRKIFLSYWDVMNVFNHKFHIPNVTPRHAGLKKNLLYWAKSAKIDPLLIGLRSTKKTRFVWLLKSFPEYEDVIIKSENFDPDKNAYVTPTNDGMDAYRKLTFDDKTTRHIKSLTYGWSGLDEYK